MITKTQIEQLISDKIKDTEIFIVEILFKNDNEISIYLDSPTGIAIENCVEISRYIRQSIDEEDNIALTVSSPGLDQPLKILQQFEKNINQKVQVKTTDNKKINGILKSIKPTADSTKPEITIETEAKIKVEGKKKKQVQKKIIELKKQEYTEVKIQIDFSKH